jgi:hypothetical protein
MFPRSSAGFAGATNLRGEVRKGGKAPLRAIFRVPKIIEE